MKLHFLGAAREVTGSCFLVEALNVRFLVDCGMVQGGRTAAARNHEPFPFDPASIRVVEGSGAFGYNAANGEFGDMIEFGILDPTKVTRTALQNAASIAGLMITTEAMVAEAPKKDEPAMPAGGGMGGMGGMDF